MSFLDRYHMHIEFPLRTLGVGIFVLWPGSKIEILKDCIGYVTNSKYVEDELELFDLIILGILTLCESESRVCVNPFSA